MAISKSVFSCISQTTRVLYAILRWDVMSFSYPEFHGKKGEELENFFKQMEVACISSHIKDPIQTLHLLQICWKDEAQKWLKPYKGDCKELNHL